LFFLAVAIRIDFDKCEKIGRGSGCSGCTNHTTPCEWCRGESSLNMVCAFKGKCGGHIDVDGSPYEPEHHVCPDPTLIKEPFLQTQTAKKEEGKWTSFYNSHFCDFPSDPWPVDRTANPAASGQDCYRANNLLGLGSRVSILQALGQQKFTGPQIECLRLTQGLLCTSNCPAYGVPVDFTSVCSDICERIELVCDAAMKNYFSKSGISRTNVVCAAPNEACSRPVEIPASDRWEHEQCFFGDPSRCKSEDCVLEPVPSAAPCCYDHSVCNIDWNGPRFDNAYWRSLIGLKFKILNPPSGGRSCEDVINGHINDIWLDRANYPYLFDDAWNQIHRDVVATKVVDLDNGFAYGGIYFMEYGSVPNYATICEPATAVPCSAPDKLSMAAIFNVAPNYVPGSHRCGGCAQSCYCNPCEGASTATCLCP